MSVVFKWDICWSDTDAVLICVIRSSVSFNIISESSMSVGALLVNKCDILITQLISLLILKMKI